MTPGAVREREGHLVVTSAAPFAFYNAAHGYVVLAGGRYEYLRVTYFAFQPPCVYLMGIAHIVHVVALCMYDYVHLERRKFVLIRAKGVLGLDETLAHYFCPVDKAEFVFRKACGLKGLGVPGAAFLISYSRGFIYITLAGMLSMSAEVNRAVRVVGVDFFDLLGSFRAPRASLCSGLGLRYADTKGEGENHKERAEDDQSVAH